MIITLLNTQKLLNQDSRRKVYYTKKCSPRISCTGGNIPWLKTGDFNDGVIENITETITELGVKNSSVKVNKPGNVLIVMYSATIGKLGIVSQKELVTNQAGFRNWWCAA